MTLLLSDSGYAPVVADSVVLIPLDEEDVDAQGSVRNRIALLLHCNIHCTVHSRMNYKRISALFGNPKS